MIQGKALAAMDTLAAIGADVPEIPRFQDDMTNINELVRMLAEAPANEMLDASGVFVNPIMDRVSL